MSDIQRYLANAAECERFARACTRAEEREAFRQMAAEWRRMVETGPRGGEPAPRARPLN